MIKAVLLDFDEVIVRSYENHLKAFLKTAKKFGFKIRKEEIIQRFGIPASEIIEELLKLKGKELKRFVEEKGKIFRRLSRKIVLVKGIKGFLKFLKEKNLKIGIVSSAARKNIEKVLKQKKLKEFFDVVISAEDVKRHKPFPDPLLKAAKILKVKPKECVYVGDSKYEMLAASKAGMIGIGILTSFYSAEELRKYGARFVCKNFKEAKNLIQKLII